VSLTFQLHEVARGWEMDYTGVAPVDRLAHAPAGWTPSEILRGAASVVVMGIRIGHGVRGIQARTRLDARPTAKYGVFVYQVFGYNILNDKLNLAAYAVTEALEDAGYETVPVPASPPYDTRELVAIFSHRHAAVAAGLGEFGWSRLVLTPTDGPYVRLVSVITTAHLDASPMYHGPRLCDPRACGTICAQACPAGVLSHNDGVGLSIGNVTYQMASLDKRGCLSAPCAICLVRCPVGNPKRA
jgi:epoxyqueuosine reductase QueG